MWWLVIKTIRNGKKTENTRVFDRENCRFARFFCLVRSIGTDKVTTRRLYTPLTLYLYLYLVWTHETNYLNCLAARYCLRISPGTKEAKLPRVGREAPG